MDTNSRQQLLIGLMLCMTSFVGIGFLLVLPALDSWQKTQAAATQLEGEVAQLTGQQQLLNQDIQKLSETPHLPKDVVIRSSDDKHLKKNTKAMLDELIRVANGLGNQLISLAPVKDDPLINAVVGNKPAAVTPPAGANTALPASGSTVTPGTPPAAGAVSPATPGTPPTTGTSATTAQATLPAVDSLLKHCRYELQMRGSYDEVLGFLSRLDHHHELVEVTDVAMLNEGGPQRQDYKQDTHFDMSKPINVKLNLDLILQPQAGLPIH